MEIKISLSNEAIDKLLKRKGYEVKKVLVHYEINEFGYGKNWIKIAYLANDKPKILDNNTIMLDDVQDMKYEKVVNELFNELLIEKLFL